MIEMPFKIGHRLGFNTVVCGEYYSPPLKTSQDISFDEPVRSRSSSSVLTLSHILHIGKIKKLIDRSVQTDSNNLKENEDETRQVNRRVTLYFQELTKARHQVLELLSIPSKSLSDLREISLKDMEHGIVHYLGLFLGLFSEPQNIMNSRPIRETDPKDPTRRSDSQVLISLFTYSWTDMLTDAQIRAHHPLFELVSILYTFGLWCLWKASSSHREMTHNEDFKQFMLDPNISETNHTDQKNQIEHNNDRDQNKKADKITWQGTSFPNRLVLDALEKPSGILSSSSHDTVANEIYCLYRKAVSLFRFVAEKSNELSLIEEREFKDSPKRDIMWDQRDGILGALINQSLADGQALLVAKMWHHYHYSCPSFPNQSRIEVAAAMRDTSEKYLIAYNSLTEVAHLRRSIINKWRHYLQVRSNFYKALTYAMMGDHSYRAREDLGKTLTYFRTSFKLLENVRRRFHYYAKMRYPFNMVFWKKHVPHEIQAVHMAVSSMITKLEMENTTAPHRSLLDVLPELCEAKSFVDIETYQLPSTDPLCCPHEILEEFASGRIHDSLSFRSPAKLCTPIECPIM
jgi:hypothetical protein